MTTFLGSSLINLVQTSAVTVNTDGTVTYSLSAAGFEALGVTVCVESYGPPPITRAPQEGDDLGMDASGNFQAHPHGTAALYCNATPVQGGVLYGYAAASVGRFVAVLTSVT